MTDYYALDAEIQEQRLLSLATAALAAWNLTGELSLIKYRENAVYSLITDTGERFALRIHRPGYHSDDALRSELQWIHALDEYGIGVPAAIPTTAGEYFTTVSTTGVPEARQVDLLAWVSGDQLGSVEDGLPDDADAVRKMYQTIGRVAARLHNQATEWQLPEGFRRHAWDEEGLVGDTPFWGPFWELEALTTEQRELLLNARNRVREELGAFGKSADNYSLIHADFVPENFLVDEGKVQIIDFDDSGFGWHLFEIATALYFIQDDKNYEVARTALLDGYRENRPLEEDALAKLPLFLVARSFTYLGWVHERAGEETAQELAPMLIDMCCRLCETYMSD